ncbi:MAG: hypothetical protein JOZ53_12585 [Planctomycetaceae bacterium]|nr:hypothetical protein [Planctomycetaceae bacterium]
MQTLSLLQREGTAVCGHDSGQERQRQRIGVIPDPNLVPIASVTRVDPVELKPTVLCPPAKEERFARFTGFRAPCNEVVEALTESSGIVIADGRRARRSQL